MILSVSGRKKVPNSCMSEEEKKEKKNERNIVIKLFIFVIYSRQS